MERTFAVYKN